MAFIVLPDLGSANEIKFLCSWLDRAPISIWVDIDAGTASRVENEKRYSVIKVSDSAVWLAVNEPNNAARLAIQVIERKPSDSMEGGLWLDLTVGSDGALSPIGGGVCWEQ